MADHLWSIHVADGAHLLTTRADAYVLKAICEGDGPVGRQLHRYRAADLLLYRRRNLYPDEAEHPESLDAPMGCGLYHP